MALRKNAPTMSPELFLNRHYGWMQFNDRVLEEAQDPANPLLERLKFLAITASNLDEFVEVRVAGILQQVEHGKGEIGPDGSHAAGHPRRPSRTHPRVCEGPVRLLARTARSGAGGRVTSACAACKRFKPEARAYLDSFYAKSVEPLMTPVTVDPAHPFPHVLNKALCLAFLLQAQAPRLANLSRRRHRASRSAAPGATSLRRRHGRIRFPARLVQAYADRLYHGYEILSAAALPRDAQQQSLSRRGRIAQHPGFGGRAASPPPQRRGCSAGNRSRRRPEIIERLASNFRLAAWQIFQVEGPAQSLAPVLYLYDRPSRVPT